jgi:hypothetical protein
VFIYNNEASAGRSTKYSLSGEGIIIYYSPLGHPEINRYSERAGGTIIIYMRILIIKGKLLKGLWLEVVSAVV